MIALRISLILGLSLHIRDAFASEGYVGHGLIGYGIVMYKPPCAHACRDTISISALNCSTMSMDDKGGMAGMDMGTSTTEPECYATDDTYLQTLAYCISTHCKDVTTWELEKFWTTYAVGRMMGQPQPKESYQEALSKVTSAPTQTLVSGDALNQTSLVTEDDYLGNFNGDTGFEKAEVVHEKYGYVFGLFFLIHSSNVLAELSSL